VSAVAAPSPAADSLLAEATALHLQGRLDEAERVYLSMLSADGEHVPLLLKLAALRLQQGRHEEAVRLTEHALQHAPDCAEAHSNLGTALHLLGRDEEAVSRYEAALAIDPDGVEAYYGLGLALHALQRNEEAIACFERALVIDPDYAEASCALGAALHALKDHQRAVEHFRRALDVDPDYVEATCGLAEALCAQGHHHAAAELYHRAVALRPGHAPTLQALGNALRSIGRHDEAIKRLQEAVAIEPSCGNHHLHLGITLEELGRVVEARSAFERAVAVDPENPHCLFAAVNVRRVREDDLVLAALSDWERRLEPAAKDEQILFHFAIGKALSDLGRDEEAFRHLLAGNRLKRQTLTYDEARTLDALREIERVFSPELVARFRGRGHPSPLPILIVGMPRSGSTLVEQILASHHAVFGGGERSDFSAAMNSVAVDLSAPDFPESCAALDADRLARLGAAYLARLRASTEAAGAANAMRITDKMLANYTVAGLVHLALPNARIIHTRRDPIDTCMSCFSKLFATDIPYAYELGELGRYYCACEALMAHWHRVLPTGVILDVQYEELVADFEPQVRRIVAHCGLEWDPSCLSFYTTERPVQTASVVQVRQPIYRTSVGRWRPGPELLSPLLRALDGRSPLPGSG
jgi:tetratricopeptide (TPR) repeat protein